MKNNNTDNFNFNSFSNLDFYKKVNSNLLDLADLNSSNKIIDLGCGNGGITEMILSMIHRNLKFSKFKTFVYNCDLETCKLKKMMLKKNCIN